MFAMIGEQTEPWPEPHHLIIEVRFEHSLQYAPERLLHQFVFVTIANLFG